MTIHWSIRWLVTSPILGVLVWAAIFALIYTGWSV